MGLQIIDGHESAGRNPRSVWQAMKRGALNRCPNCGDGRLFASFVKTNEYCGHCGQAFHHHRADDLPAYLVIFIVGHIVVGLFMGVEATSELTLWQHLAMWIPLTIVLSLALLRPVKGAVVGLQWALYMHGFGGHDDVIESHPEA
ncbi:MAG: DUF983 domain-containing protein [Rhizobiaceae bacterium]